MRFFLGVILYVSMYMNNIFFHGTDKKMIIGVWQFGCVEVNTGYFDTYQFLKTAHLNSTPTRMMKQGELFRLGELIH